MVKKLGRLYSAAIEGIDAKIIEIEADINVGLHSFNIVGLGDRSVSEAKERVNSALKNSGIKPPNRENRKITINLAPADVKKTGAHYDLAIALGYLLATKQMRAFDSAGKIFLGELALDGRLRPVNGALNIAQAAARAGFTHIFLPRENANEAAAIGEIAAIALDDLREAISVLEGSIKKEAARFCAEGECISDRSSTMPTSPRVPRFPDLSDIKGQANAKRALMIAAAGQHNILLFGPPGVGKTFLSQALAGIMPPLADDEAVETTKIWSAAGMGSGGLMHVRPFRAPHHGSSITALVGGGPDPRPGEISLAHNGILFLDEIPEFPRNALEALRQPLESGMIRLARARASVTLPARFILIAAMNPCPCGFYGDPEKECRCSAYEIVKYQKRISGPLLDRIDLQVKVGRVAIEDLRGDDEKIRKTADAANATGSARRTEGESAAARELVLRARTLQLARQSTLNASLSSREAHDRAALDPDARSFLATLSARDLSPRGYYRLLKTARTIADLDGEPCVNSGYLAEAFSYRLRDIF